MRHTHSSVGLCIAGTIACSVGSALLPFVPDAHLQIVLGFFLSSCFLIMGLIVLHRYVLPVQSLTHSLAEPLGTHAKAPAEENGPVWLRQAQKTIRSIVSDLEKTRKNTVQISDFLSMATHQLRTPLNNIKWILDTFRHGKAGALTSDQQALLTDAALSVERMKHVIASVLTLSKMENDTLKPSPTEFHLQPLLSNIVRSFEPEFLSKHQAVSLRCPATMTITTDQYMLTQILDNLLGNAIKYTPPEGKITLRVRRTSDQIEVTIADTGCGIPPDQQEKIFLKYFRGDNAATRLAPGTGLGLHIVKTLLQAMGGRIHFTSKEKVGTTFTVFFPVSPASL